MLDRNLQYKFQSVYLDKRTLNKKENIKNT